MKKVFAAALSLWVATFSAVPTWCVAPYTVEQTYRVLQITAEDFIADLKGAEVSEQDIASFLKELGQEIDSQEALTEENFDSVLFAAMYRILQSGSYNNLYIAMVSLYSEQMSTMLATREIPEEFQPLYRTVKACLLGAEELQIFSDVPAGHWAKESVEALVVDGIVNGMGGGRFAPEETVSREQFVKMAVDCLGLETSEEPLPFTDAKKDEWYYPYVAAAYQNNIISGVSDTAFGVEQPMQRQDMAVVIDRILQAKGVSLPQQADVFEIFKDGDQIDFYAQEAVKRLCRGGLIAGVSQREFAPHALVTRAQAARMIDQMRLALAQ